MCDRWLDFRNFLADMGAAPESHTIERVDVNGNYEPENCKWIPATKQAHNTRRSRMVEIDGDRICLSEACRRRGLNYRTIQSRINILGLSPEEAIGVVQNRYRKGCAERQNHATR